MSDPFKGRPYTNLVLFCKWSMDIAILNQWEHLFFTSSFHLCERRLFYLGFLEQIR